MHDVIAVKADRYWVKQKDNKTIIKYRVVDSKSIDEKIEEYYKFIPIGKKRHTAEIKLIQNDEQILKRKKTEVGLRRYNQFR